jgi:hypothetical protein
VRWFEIVIDGKPRSYRNCKAAVRSGDMAADFISALATGTSLDIAATDQSRPIATTLASAMDTMRIFNPIRLLEHWRRGVSHFLAAWM